MAAKNCPTKDKSLSTEKIRKGKYLIAIYLPTSLFTLRMSTTTKTGGKTLFLPTPYAVKLALVDVGFRLFAENVVREFPEIYDEIKAEVETGNIKSFNEGSAKKLFEIVRNRAVRFLPPKYCVVTHTFQKMLQPTTEKDDKATKKSKGPLSQTINYREYCYFLGELQIAINVEDMPNADLEFLKAGLKCINYFGKRGSFFQWTGFFEDKNEDYLNENHFTCPENTPLPNEELIEHYGTLQPLDDLSSTSKNLFDKINSFSETILRTEDRPYTSTLIPYHLVRSSRRYSFYIRGAKSKIINQLYGNNTV